MDGNGGRMDDVMDDNILNNIKSVVHGR